MGPSTASTICPSTAEARWEQMTCATGRWFVLHTKSRQEKVLADALEAMGVTYFLPLMTKISYHGRRKFAAQVPLFPSYVFLHGDLDNAYAADRTKRIASVIPVIDQERMTGELRSIYLAVAYRASLDPYPYLKKGIRVVVRSGPFEGLEGVIENRTKNDRLILQVEMLGQASSLEIDGTLLEPAE